jgi:hypothetical protein
MNLCCGSESCSFAYLFGALAVSWLAFSARRSILSSGVVELSTISATSGRDKYLGLVFVLCLLFSFIPFPRWLWRPIRRLVFAAPGSIYAERFFQRG